jgi:hypothetical protein
MVVAPAGSKINGPLLTLYEMMVLAHPVPVVAGTEIGLLSQFVALVESIKAGKVGAPTKEHEGRGVLAKISDQEQVMPSSPPTWSLICSVQVPSALMPVKVLAKVKVPKAGTLEGCAGKEMTLFLPSALKVPL